MTKKKRKIEKLPNRKLIINTTRQVMKDFDKACKEYYNELIKKNEKKR